MVQPPFPVELLQIPLNYPSFRLPVSTGIPDSFLHLSGFLPCIIQPFGSDGWIILCYLVSMFLSWLKVVLAFGDGITRPGNPIPGKPD